MCGKLGPAGPGGKGIESTRAGGYLHIMMMRTLLIFAVLPLAACNSLPFFKDRAASPEPLVAETAPAPAPLAPPQGAKTAAALDTTTAAEKAAALAPPPAPAGETRLGTAAVSLGNVAEPGFWLRSSLVKSAGKGRVETASGSIEVDLMPGTGAAQLSLAAFRALNLPLTGLPEVTIFAR